MYNPVPNRLLDMDDNKENNMTLWEIISNPPRKLVQGIYVPTWQVPTITDREEMVKAIEDFYKKEIEIIKVLTKEIEEALVEMDKY